MRRILLWILVACVVSAPGCGGGASYVAFGGEVNPGDDDYVTWGNTEIKVNIPLTAQSGDVTVTVGSETSNGYEVRVILAPPNLTGGEQF
jgi:hypothetical protein